MTVLAAARRERFDGEVEMATEVTELLGRSARLRLFVAIRRTLDRERQRDLLVSHLRWMIGEEKAGRIFLSGPIMRGDENHPDGLTVIRASDLEAARSIVMRDPLIEGGAVTVDLCEWIVNEGCLDLRLTLSDSHLEFGADV